MPWLDYEMSMEKFVFVPKAKALQLSSKCLRCRCQDHTYFGHINEYVLLAKVSVIIPLSFHARILLRMHC